MKDTEKFLKTITGFDKFCDAYLEVVTNYTSAKYFADNKLNDAIQFAKEMSEVGNEIHFGPAVRKQDLGFQRSDRKNVIWTKCCWVDIDSPDKNIPAEDKLTAAEKLKNDFIEALKSYNLEPTFIVKSGHGFHIYFVLRRVHLDPSLWAPIQIALITLAKGDQQAKDIVRLLRFPDTYNYKDKENPRKVEIIYESDKIYDETDFSQLVKDFGPKLIANITPTEVKPLGFIPPCIGHLLDTNKSVDLGYRHQVRLVVATFGYHEGWSVEDVINKLKHLTDDPKKSEDDIRGVYKSLSSDSTKYNVGCGEGSNLKALIDAGITACDKTNCQFGKTPVQSTSVSADKKEKEIIKSADFPELVDLVLDDKGNIAYLVKAGNNLTIQYEHQYDDKYFIPPPKDKVLWMIPLSSSVIQHYVNDTDEALFNDLVNYFKTISELPDDNHYKFLAAFVMHTYLVERFEYSPMIWFYAIPERGKTRTGKAITYASYRGVHIITLRESHIIRLAKDLRSTLFIDVSDLQSKMESNSVEDVILNRYEKGAQIARVLYPDKGAFDDTVYYDIYGATIVATNETVNDILSTRTIQIIMPESQRQFNDDVKPIHGLPFRERLLGFRARWMDKNLPVVDKPCNGRLGDILRSIRQVVNIVSPNETWFMNFVSGVEQRRKLSGADGLDAQVVNAIKDSMNSMKQGHIFHDDILRNLNANKSEKEKISPHKLGKITSRLGFEKYTSGQQRGIYWNADLLKRLCERYGIEYYDNTFQIK